MSTIDQIRKYLLFVDEEERERTMIEERKAGQEVMTVDS